MIWRVWQISIVHLMGLTKMDGEISRDASDRNKILPKNTETRIAYLLESKKVENLMHSVSHIFKNVNTNRSISTTHNNNCGNIK